MFCCPLLSPALSDQTPGETPLGHNPPCMLPYVGRCWSGPCLVGRIGSRVRVSVSFLKKYPPGSVLRCLTAAENGGYDQGCCVQGEFDLLSGGLCYVMVGGDYGTVTIWSVDGRCRGRGDGATAPARRRAFRATWRNNSSYTLQLKCLAYDVRIYQNCTN